MPIEPPRPIFIFGLQGFPAENLRKPVILKVLWLKRLSVMHLAVRHKGPRKAADIGTSELKRTRDETPIKGPVGLYACTQDSCGAKRPTDEQHAMP